MNQLAVIGFVRGRFFGALFTIAGGGLLARALTNLSGKRLVGMGAGRRAVDVQKTSHPATPPGR